MKKVLIVEDNPEVLISLLELFLVQEHGKSFEPEWDITIVTTEEMAKELDPGLFNYILLDHDLPNRGNGGRVLNHWVSEYEAIGVVKNGESEKIIAISAVPVNNERLLNLGADTVCNKMDSDFIEQLKQKLDI